MASENETVADIVAAMRNESHAGDESCLELVAAKMRSYADRIEAAHRREIGERRGERNGILNANASLAADNDRLRRDVAELQKCLKAAVGEKCSMCAYIDNEMSAFYGEPVCGNKGCKYKRWRKALKTTKGGAE